MRHELDYVGPRVIAIQQHIADLRGAVLPQHAAELLTLAVERGQDDLRPDPEQGTQRVLDKGQPVAGVAAGDRIIEDDDRGAQQFRRRQN